MLRTKTARHYAAAEAALEGEATAENTNAAVAHAVLALIGSLHAHQESGNATYATRRELDRLILRHDDETD